MTLVTLVSTQSYSAQLRVRNSVGGPYSRIMHIRLLCFMNQYCLPGTTHLLQYGAQGARPKTAPWTTADRRTFDGFWFFFYKLQTPVAIVCCTRSEQIASFCLHSLNTLFSTRHEQLYYTFRIFIISCH